jgi:hypothetical protein
MISNGIMTKEIPMDEAAARIRVSDAANIIRMEHKIDLVNYEGA